MYSKLMKKYDVMVVVLGAKKIVMPITAEGDCVQ